MTRKDDPVFNVKFVQLVESQACLWNYTHPGYSKKEEVQKAWQHVANEIKDTVRNSRERWRTIRSSFLRSLKLARTQTGRGKRKYYLSKYLQFLIPYTKSRACHKQQLLPNAPPIANPNTNPNTNTNTNSNPNGGMVLRKPSTSTAAATYLAAAAAAASSSSTRIGHMRLLGAGAGNGGGNMAAADEDTKEESMGTDAMPAECQEDEHEEEEAPTTLRLQAIKVEQQQQQHQQHQQQQQQSNEKLAAQHSLVTLPVTMAAALRNNMDWTELTEWLKGSSSNSCNQLQFQHQQHSSNLLALHGHGAVAAGTSPPLPPPSASTPAPSVNVNVPAVVQSTGIPTDADYSFLISLHPYLKEMSGKQNRRFRQKVVGLIDNVLDDVDM